MANPMAELATAVEGVSLSEDGGGARSSDSGAMPPSQPVYNMGDGGGGGGGGGGLQMLPGGAMPHAMGGYQQDTTVPSEYATYMMGGMGVAPAQQYFAPPSGLSRSLCVGVGVGVVGWVGGC
jgi:hypothetical protein